MKWICLSLAIFIIAIICIVIYIKIKARRLSQSLFGTDSLIDGYKSQKELLSLQPKSISAMTRIYLPLIMKDFPEFNYEEFEVKTENMLKSAFCAITENNIEILQNASNDLEKSIKLIIENNNSQKQNEHFNDVKIYQTEIAGYKKQSGTCIITLQSAIGYHNYIEKNGEIISGDKNFIEQCKYNTDIIYVQNLDEVSASEFKTAVGTICPNCGAAITNLGLKYCEYCGTRVKTLNINVWSINKYKKI